MTSIAIVRLDAQGIVTSWNPGAERIKGYRADEVIGTSFERFYREEDRARELPKQLLAIAARNGSVEDTGWRVRADGSLFWAHLVITALRDERGTTSGYVKIVRDLTGAKQFEDDRQAFLQNFAHDFSSPIAALRGYVDLLDEAMEHECTLVDRLSGVADHLVAMMAQLNDHLQHERASALPLPIAPVDAAQIILEAGSLVVPGDPFQRLVVSATDVGLVAANRTALRRSLVNVIENAVKYSEGVVVIHAERSGDRVRISVTDHGRGIDPGDLGTIFAPRARGRLADPYDGGSGIGLASVRELVERQGGSARLESALGVGTTVTLELRAA